MMYKPYSHINEPYMGLDYSHTIPINLFSSLPSGTPEPCVPSAFEPETLEKVILLI